MIKTQILNLFRKPFTGEYLGEKLSRRLKKNPESFFLRKLVPDNSLHSKNNERLCNRYGANFLLDLSDYQQWLLYFSDDHDSSLNFLSYIEPGFTILDIGGNIGQTALIAAQKTGESGKVISFEPYPETIERFEKNLELNKSIKNIKLEKFALGDEQSTITLFQDCVTNSGGNRVLHSSVENPAGVKQVAVTTLDLYSAGENLSRIDLIKIDVEGFEMNVLKGAEQTLLKFRPLLIVEVDEKNLNSQGAAARDIIAFFHEYHYEMIDLSTMKDFYLGNDQFIHTDILCTPNK